MDVVINPLPDIKKSRCKIASDVIKLVSFIENEIRLNTLTGSSSRTIAKNIAENLLKNLKTRYPNNPEKRKLALKKPLHEAWELYNSEVVDRGLALVPYAKKLKEDYFSLIKRMEEVFTVNEEKDMSAVTTEGDKDASS